MLQNQIPCHAYKCAETIVILSYPKPDKIVYDNDTQVIYVAELIKKKEGP